MNRFPKPSLAPRILVALTLCFVAYPAFGQGPSDAAIEYFEKHVRPILVNNCYSCHSANTKAMANLRVDDRNGLIDGGGRGPAVVPGQPGKSLLIQAVKQTHATVKMPPMKHLADEEIAKLSKWIADGVAWPKLETPLSFGKLPKKYEKLKKEHWAWQPLQQPKVPAVRDAAWPRSDIDAFVLAKLEAKGLKPTNDADRVALIRRVTFDLTGLPPTLAQIDAFLRDDATDAFEKVVDRLLTSSAFGERWARHWLDVARYGESTGPSRNIPYPHAWRYRDYVIDVFTRDKPYDQFIREQIAGDLLPAATTPERDEHRVATGFLALGTHDVNQRFKVRFIMDTVDEQIDTMGRAILALTTGCARCHDHKFDPIPQADYYALAGIFRSSDLCAGVRSKMGGGGMDYYDTSMLLPLGSETRADPDLPKTIAKTQKALAVAKAELQKVNVGTGGATTNPEQKAARQKVNDLQAELVALTDPAARGGVALGARDAKTVSDTEIRIRGEAEKLGPVVPRGFLSLVPVPDAPNINPKQSGRLELAQWLTSPQNPLTPRVMVNRVWRYLFDQGIVSSVDNFGVTGDVPSHPELLDHLTTRFIADGWSIKKLVRNIVLSRTYQLGSESVAANVAVDPGNRLVWRHRPRRLEAEEIRDAMLAVAGTLDTSRPTASPAKDLKVMEMANNGPQAKQITDDAERSVHRSVYLPLLRGLTPRSLEVFDFAEQGLVTGSRDATTVAPQALYLLNDPFVRTQARSLAQRVLRQNGDEASRIALAYRFAVGRAPTANEVERTSRYLTDYAATAQGADARTAAWASFTQALLASAEFRFIR
jgi:cytochrome c553